MSTGKPSTVANYRPKDLQYELNGDSLMHRLGTEDSQEEKGWLLLATMTHDAGGGDAPHRGR